MLFKPEPRSILVPRDYQRRDHDESFRLWDAGERGVLSRVFTGGGKTPLTCMKIETWLKRGPNNRAMIISYERDLVWQFAQEVEDFLGITPGIEMGDEHVSGEPRIVVACRASLLPVPGPRPRQIADMKEYGFTRLDGVTAKLCERFLKHLAANGDADIVADELDRLRAEMPDHGRAESRLHKFDWRLNWMVIFDEAHRHPHSLKSVGHIVEWFEQNPNSRRSGLTATPKRGDGISIGHKMFPAVAIDYPLYHLTKPCAVKDGWAVPYVQKYIEVQGVDFKNLKQVAGDFDEEELERVLGEEGQLARLIEPLLALVGDRRTLIFCPGVQMAKNVALYINARRPCRCPACDKVTWHPSRLIGDGAECPCGRPVAATDVVRDYDDARTLHGDSPPHERKATYRAHQGGHFQFLSVCGLCREGYNDPDISCVAVLRPVSKKASSLAEQMKGRGCRPCRSAVPVLNQLLTAEERVAVIAASEKPDCLIVDLVGITGLADCASTVQIYAEGLPDEVVSLAVELLETGGRSADGANVEETVKKAKALVEAERADAERRRREEAERRAKARAEVQWTEHGVGVGSNAAADRASDGAYRLLKCLGMDVRAVVSPRKAGRMIDMLKKRVPAKEVAYKNGLAEGDWQPEGPSSKQTWRLRQLGFSSNAARTRWDASQIISAALNPDEFEIRKVKEINQARDADTLTGIGKDIVLAKPVLSADAYDRLANVGRRRKAVIQSAAQVA